MAQFLEDSEGQGKQEAKEDRSADRRHVVRHGGIFTHEIERVARGKDQKQQAGRQRDRKVGVHIFFMER